MRRVVMLVARRSPRRRMVGCTAPLLSRVKHCRRPRRCRGNNSPGVNSDSLAKLRVTSLRPCSLQKGSHCTTPHSYLSLAFKDSPS